MNINNKSNSISSRTHVRLDQWQSLMLNSDYLESLYRRFTNAPLHYADYAFFQYDDKNLPNMVEAIQSDIQWYLWLINNNIPLLKELNYTQKEIAVQFIKAVPIGGMDKQDTELSEKFLEFSQFVKEEIQEPFIRHFKPADHCFLGYRNESFVYMDNGTMRFRMEMPLPRVKTDQIITFPTKQLGDATALIQCLDELKALEHTLQKSYKKLTCGLSLSDTPYHDLTQVIINEHQGKEYLMPYYDQVNTDFVPLMISMVIRLRLGILRFLYRLSI